MLLWGLLYWELKSNHIIKTSVREKGGYFPTVHMPTLVYFSAPSLPLFFSSPPPSLHSLEYTEVHFSTRIYGRLPEGSHLESHYILFSICLGKDFRVSLKLQDRIQSCLTWSMFPAEEGGLGVLFIYRRYGNWHQIQQFGRPSCLPGNTASGAWHLLICWIPFLSKPRNN